MNFSHLHNERLSHSKDCADESISSFQERERETGNQPFVQRSMCNSQKVALFFLGMIMWSLFLLHVNAIARWERDSIGCVRRDPLDSNHLGDPNGTNMIGKLLKWSPESNARKLEMGPLNTQNDHCPIKLWKSHVWLNWLPFNLLNRFMTHVP